MKSFFTVLLLGITVYGNAQPSLLRISKGTILPKDSLKGNRLVKSLDDFLIAAQGPNEENRFIAEKEKIETFILLDEINGMQKDIASGDSLFYTPYLLNAVSLSDSEYLIQVAYNGLQNNTPMLRAVFELVAHQSENGYVFSSPLLRNTRNWKTQKTGNNTFHYQSAINQQNVKLYSTLAASFDAKLKSTGAITEFYCCDKLTDMERLIGVLYKSDYNGYTESVWASKLGKKKLVVLGNNNERFDNMDPHDLWHDRLSVVVPRNKVYKPVDEACAYLYGGSWGISWKDILKTFKAKVASNPGTDWMAIKETPVNFSDSKEKHLMADYVVNALIVQKLEKEKGFAAVWELLNCGKWEKGNDSYYKTLEKLTGITKANYNEQVWALIRQGK